MTQNHSEWIKRAEDKIQSHFPNVYSEICSFALRKLNIFQTLKPSLAFDIHFSEELRANFSMNNFLAPRLYGGFKNLPVILTVTIPAGKGGGKCE